MGTEIIAGTYVIGAQAEGQTCEWARLINLGGTEGQVVEQGMWIETLQWSSEGARLLRRLLERSVKRDMLGVRPLTAAHRCYHFLR